MTLVEDSSSPIPVPTTRTSLQRPDKLDLQSEQPNTAVKSSPRLSLKIYECKAGSSEFVEKSDAELSQQKQDTLNGSRDKNNLQNDKNSTGNVAKDRQQPSSPVTLRHQKPAEMRKLVDLKQPEPNGLWRRGGEDRASDRKTWGSMRSSPRRSEGGSEEAIIRPNSIQSGESIQKNILSSR